MERKSIMALTSTQIIRNYIKNIPELKVKEKGKSALYQQLIQLKNVDIITIKKRSKHTRYGKLHELC